MLFQQSETFITLMKEDLFLWWMKAQDWSAPQRLIVQNGDVSKAVAKE